MISLKETSAIATDMALRLGAQKEVVIRERLKFLIDQKILVVIEGPQVMTQDPSTNEIMFSQAIDLKIRNQEVFEEMAQEIQSLKERISKLTEER